MSTLLPAGRLPRAVVDLVRGYASGEHGEYESAKMLQAMLEKGDSEMPDSTWEDFGWTMLRSLLGVGLGGMGMAGGGLFLTALFSTDRLCNILIVNDSPVPLRLHGEPAQFHGELRGSPVMVSDLKDMLSGIKVNYVPEADDDSVGFGLWAFGKSFTLGIGTWGTEGLVDFESDAKVLRKGFRVSWQVPQSGHVSCGLSFDTVKKAQDWFDRDVDKKDVNNTKASDEHDGVQLTARAAHSTVNGNTSLLVVLLESSA